MPRLRTLVERDVILHSIFELYPQRKIELNFETPFQLLIAVMLSAQMTDKGVNRATTILFQKVRAPEDLLQIQQEEVENMLRSINYYRVKTRHIFQTAQKLLKDFDGKIPDTLSEIQKLP